MLSWFQTQEIPASFYLRGSHRSQRGRHIAQCHCPLATPIDSDTPWHFGIPRSAQETEAGYPMPCLFILKAMVAILRLCCSMVSLEHSSWTCAFRVGSYLERSLLSRLSGQHSHHAEISLSSRVRSFQEYKPVSFRPYVIQNLGLTLE